MKLVLYTWGSNSDEILKKSLMKLGHEVILYSMNCEHYTKDIRFAQGLINLIHEYGVNGVISNDYFPIISMVCNIVGILYYSWVYDSPHLTLFSSASKYSCNRIGCFDRALVERLNSLGIETVRHLPLGVDWTDASTIPNVLDGYICDVSFVGSMYTDAHNYYDDLCDDPVVKNRAEELIEKQCFDYRNDYIGSFFIENTKSSESEITVGGFEGSLRERARNILKQGNLLPGDEYIEDIEYIFLSHFLEKKVTIEERKILLETIAEKNIDFSLYTGSSLERSPELMKYNKGYVNYHSQMPLVFRRSRINLNITLRSIKTGITLRALDIMGCGGFLLSNYQPELAECFEEGKELVMFYGLEDCLEKIDYYLKHDNERKCIAKGGYKAVKERFNHIDQLKKLIDESV